MTKTKTLQCLVEIEVRYDTPEALAKAEKELETRGIHLEYSAFGSYGFLGVRARKGLEVLGEKKP